MIEKYDPNDDEALGTVQPWLNVECKKAEVKLETEFPPINILVSYNKAILSRDRALF